MMTKYVDAEEAVDVLWEGIQDTMDIDTGMYDWAKGAYLALLREGYQIVKVES
jgi:hypothetical protein